MNKTYAILLLGGTTLLAGCSDDPPPTSVQEFLDKPIMLEAAVVRCSANRTESKYEPECVNARQAVSIIEAREERARRDAFEAQSERKREALRRTQQAAAAARQRAAEAEALRKEAEYLAQFGELPMVPDGESRGDEAPNAPGAVIPAPVDGQTEETGQTQVIFEDARPPSDPPPATDGGNAPTVEREPESDIDAVREELRRRNETPTD